MSTFCVKDTLSRKLNFMIDGYVCEVSVQSNGHVLNIYSSLLLGKNKPKADVNIVDDMNDKASMFTHKYDESTNTLSVGLNGLYKTEPNEDLINNMIDLCLTETKMTLLLSTNLKETETCQK